MPEYTICFVMKDDQVLLSRKVSGKLGDRKWNGYGGKVEFGETPETNAIKEVEEECGLKIKRIKPVGSLRFIHLGVNKVNSGLCHIFVSDRFNGTPKDSEEMVEPTWYPRDQLPVDQMWPTDQLWVPAVLNGWSIRGKINYNSNFRPLRANINVTLF